MDRRLSAGMLAIIVALVSFVALTRAFGTAEPQGPTPPGIFSDVGGRITYGDDRGIWAVDPTRPDDPNDQIQLSTESGTPLAWSPDGSKLLIVSHKPRRSPVSPRLFVLNADGTETTLTMDWCKAAGGFCGRGGSFSPDGSQVVYDAAPEDTWRSSIYVVDAQGGRPRVLLSGGRRLYREIGASVRSWLSDPTYSPDGTQIAYFDHQFDGPSQLRVMNSDGRGVRVLLDGTGYHMSNLTWSPDGERIAFGGGYHGSTGLFVVGADGSGPTLVIPDGAFPHWSPDGSRISFQRIMNPVIQGTCNFTVGGGTLEIADRDGTQVQEFGFCAKSGPWNPLAQPQQELAEVPAAGEGGTFDSRLVWGAVLLALGATFVAIRRRKPQTSEPG